MLQAEQISAVAPTVPQLAGMVLTQLVAAVEALSLAGAVQVKHLVVSQVAQSVGQDTHFLVAASNLYPALHLVSKH